MIRLPRPDSLASRHFWASALLLPFLLGFSAYALDEAFRNSLLSAEREALRAQVYSLLGAAEPSDTSLYFPDVLADPRFGVPDSGLYALVVRKNGDIIWRSESLIMAEITDLNFVHKSHIASEAGIMRFGETELGQKSLFSLSYDTIWRINEKDQVFGFIVMHTKADLDKELAAYRSKLWTWLGGMAVLLILSQALIARWGLSPLKTLANDLDQFQKGETNHLGGKYPKEIRPVTHNLNQVLKTEQQQRERYKNTLSDLAHSLKTPLSIIRSHIESNRESIHREQNAPIDEQISRMSDIIGHQLRRATLSSTNVLQDQVDLQNTVARLCNALQKVYRDKNVSFTNLISDNTGIPGDDNDIMELLGNIIENAFKYCHSKVQISAIENESDLIIKIEDDGPGVTKDQRTEIISRGARADTATPGQGIGLAIAVDIISSYNGALKVEDSSLGGASFNILFPLLDETV